MTRADRLLIGLVAILLPWLYVHFWSADSGQQLSVLAEGQPPTILPLYPDQELHIQGILGDSIIRIEDGRARFVASPCTNKVCIRQGWIGDAGEVAACLPNRVSLQILGGDSRFDAVNF